MKGQSLWKNLNSKINYKYMNDFCGSYNLSSFITKSTCYKYRKNLCFTYLFLTNSSNSVQNFSLVETSLYDFYGMITTALGYYQE